MLAPCKSRVALVSESGVHDAEQETELGRSEGLSEGLSDGMLEGLSDDSFDAFVAFVAFGFFVAFGLLASTIEHIFV